MKIFSIIILLFSISFNALAQSNPPNAVSEGQDPAAGTSDAPTGPSEREEEQVHNSSMGGAPNVGGGMGTGTGAGSRVGNDLDEGNVTAGALSGEENE